MNKKYFLLFFILLIASFLRLYKLDQNPPSLYWDEASLGYNAFAILTTGHDEHGEFLPIARFIAFGDYKPPGYIYSIVPGMAIFGVNEFAIRFPSAISGILMVLCTYFLVRFLTQNEITALIAAGLLAISPWSIQLSRAAFEAHLAAFLNLLAIVCFINFPKHKWLLPLSFTFLCLSFYTFNANRILAPLFILLLSAIFYKQLLANKKWLLISVIISIIIILPSVGYLQTRESKLRFQEVSIFTSLDIVKKSNERIARSGNTWLAKIIHNRRRYFAQEFLNHYIDNFKGQFLFINGDQNPRLSIQSIGELYIFELPFLLIGLYVVFGYRNWITALLFGWLVISPIPAATARETPHMLRIASILPTFQIFTAIGFVQFWKWIRVKSSMTRFGTLASLSFIIILSFIYFQHNYWIHYPKEWYGQWQYGYKEMVQKVTQLKDDYDRVTVTQNYGRPYIYFLLYNKINPLHFSANRKAERDWYGLWSVYGFDKYDFTEKPPEENETVLMVNTGSMSREKKLAQIVGPDGKIIFEIGKY